MARKSKFEEEKNRLDSVRRRIDEAIEEVENMQQARGNEEEYSQALIYQEFAKKLREIKTACGEGKLKEIKKENG